MKKKNLIIILIIAVIAALAGGILLLVPRGEPQITIEKARLVPSEMEKHVASAFMLIINDGKGSDSLIGCSLKESPSSWAELHDIKGGRMKRIKEIKITSNKITVLKAGSLHIMFFNVGDDLGEEVTLLLRFKKSGVKEVKARVKSLGA